MGCDIHFYVEQKAEDGWVRVPDSKGPKHPYYNPNAEDRFKEWFDKPEWDIGRNYMVFGRLARVRWSKIVPIAEPKSVPEDMSAEVKQHWIDGQGDWHTPSWFSAKELLDAKDEKLKMRVYMSMTEYKDFLASGLTEPDQEESYYEDPPPGSTVVSNEEMTRILGLMAFWDGAEYYTPVEWHSPSLEMNRHLFDVILPAMLAVEPDPEKIRIVFWFDN